MLNLVDQALENFLRGEVPLHPTAVDVSFDAPDKTWGASITRPTVNIFLWDIRRNAGRARSGHDVRERNGKMVRQWASPRMDLKYLLTAWTNESRDEHNLVGQVMRAILANRYVPPEYFPPELEDAHPLLEVWVTSTSEKKQTDIWSTLGGQLKAGLPIEVTFEVDLELFKELAEPPSEVDLGVSDTEQPSRTSRRAGTLGAAEETTADAGP